MTHESTEAWHELLDTLRGLDRASSRATAPSTTTGRSPTATGPLATTLGVAFDTYLFAEPSRPVFLELNTPFRRDRRWGGDNTDAFYRIAPVDPSRRYRISGNRGDAIYFALTGYNEPAPGTWSDKIVLHLNDTDLDIDADGNFSLDIGPVPDIAVLDDPRLPGRPRARAARSSGRSRRSTSRSRSGTATPRPPPRSGPAPPGCGRCS